MKNSSHRNKGYLPFILLMVAIFALLEKTSLGDAVAKYTADFCLAVAALGALFIFGLYAYVKLKPNGKQNFIKAEADE